MTFPPNYQKVCQEYVRTAIGPILHSFGAEMGAALAPPMGGLLRGSNFPHPSDNQVNFIRVKLIIAYFEQH
jgi:hypothetical protein